MDDMTAAEQQEEGTSDDSTLESFLTGDLRLCVDAIPPEIRAMTEHELYKTGAPQAVDFYLRKNLHKSIDEARKSGRTTITAASVFNDVTPSQNFRKLCRNHYRLAMVLLPPVPTDRFIEEAANFALDRIRREVLTMPLTDRNVGHLIKAFEFIANRAWGPMIQRHQIDARHQHLNLNQANQNPNDAIKRLDELRAKLIEQRDVTEADTDPTSST